MWRVCRRARRHAERAGAVVDAPDRRHRRVGIGAETPIGIGVGRKDRHRIRQQRLHPADSVAEGGRTFRRFRGEDVLARLVVDADMHVHARARVLGERLGHEAGFAPCFKRHALGGVLVENGVVGRAQHVGVMLQRQFELAWRIFADRAFERHAQRIGGAPQFVQERRGLLHFAQRILIVLRRARAGERPARKLHAAAGRPLASSRKNSSSQAATGVRPSLAKRSITRAST